MPVARAVSFSPKWLPQDAWEFLFAPLKGTRQEIGGGS